VPPQVSALLDWRTPQGQVLTQTNQGSPGSSIGLSPLFNIKMQAAFGWAYVAPSLWQGEPWHTLRGPCRRDRSQDSAHEMIITLNISGVLATTTKPSQCGSPLGQSGVILRPPWRSALPRTRSAPPSFCSLGLENSTGPGSDTDQPGKPWVRLAFHPCSFRRSTICSSFGWQ
jgi:hypothetical protein